MRRLVSSLTSFFPPFPPSPFLLFLFKSVTTFVPTTVISVATVQVTTAAFATTTVFTTAVIKKAIVSLSCAFSLHHFISISLLPCSFSLRKQPTYSVVTVPVTVSQVSVTSIVLSVPFYPGKSAETSFPGSSATSAVIPTSSAVVPSSSGGASTLIKVG